MNKQEDILVFLTNLYKCVINEGTEKEISTLEPTKLGLNRLVSES
jgi:hypothetical protein